MSTLASLEIIRRFEARNALQLPGIDALAHHIEVLKLSPRQNAFRQGEPATHVYVVRNGLLKQLYTREDGTEWIKSFTGPGDMFACIHAMARGKPATFASVAIKSSIVERIDFRWLEKAALGSTDWQRALRLGFQNLAELKVERERDLLTLSARELYAKLTIEPPAWLPSVPQKDLAAHLGVTPVGLNRIVRAARRPRR